MKTIKNLLSFSFLLLVLTLTGCGGGGGGGDGGGNGSGGNGGSKSAPKVLTFPASFSYSGVMEANQGVSYFKITGLIANEEYQLGINTSSDIAYIGYSVSTYDGMFNCMSSTSSGDNCKANSSGELYVLLYSVSGPTAQSTYTLTMYSKISEGTPSAPKDLSTSLPYSATLPATNFKSLFLVNNLTAGNSYTVGLSDGSDTRIDLRVYQDQFLTQGCSALTNVSAKSCTLTTARSQLWITVYGTGDFTLTVTDNGSPTPDYVTEGTLSIPKAMNYSADGLTGSGQVDSTDSYYVINGLAANTEYRVRLQNIVDDNINLSVYTDNTYSNAACVSENKGVANESCLVTADALGSVWLRVSGADTVQYLGANFDIYTYTYYPNEGTYDANVQLNYASGLTYTGTVDTYSYYQINGLLADTSYFVDLSAYTNIVSGVTTATGTCYTQEESAGVQRCLVVSDPAGIIKLRVRAGSFWTSGLGTDFTLNVTLSPLQSEGTSSVPVVLTPGVTYNGEVGGTNSYYRVDSLTTGSAYTITVSGMNSSNKFYIFDNAADTWLTSSAICNGYGSYNSCTRQAAGSSMWIMVDDNNAISGAAITLDVNASPYQAEGSKVLPIVLGYGTADLPHSGSTDTTESYYEMQNFTAGTEYVISLNNTVASGSYATMYIYDDLTKFGSTVYGDYIGYRSVNAGTSGFSRVTPTATTLWVMIDGNDSGVGSFYELNAVLSPLAENITIDSTVTTLPFTRASSTNEVASAYVVTNLLPSQLYNISVTGMTADVELKVANYNTSSPSLCDSQIGTADEQCLYETSSTGELYIDIDASKTLYGAYFNLGLSIGPSNEGSLAAPVEVVHDIVAGTTTRSSEVGSRISYYKITGLTAGKMYEVKMTGLDGDGNLIIANDSAYRSAYQCTSNNAGNVDEICGGLADVNGDLYVAVESAYSSSFGNSKFTLEIINGIQPDGSSTAAQAITHTTGNLTTFSGKVDITNSYYAISGLNPKATYTVSITGLTDNAQLYVYTDSGYSVLACSSTLTGTVDDSCNVTIANGGAAGSASLYVKVAGGLTVTGTTYTLEIQ